VAIKKKPRLTENKLPSYKKPPVNEVAIGFVAANLEEFKIPHIGLLWDRYRKQYPLIEHAAPLATREGILVDSVTGLPLPRVWFKDDSETRILQFQSNAFYFNWRSRKEDHAYPSYETIAKEFRSNLTVFAAFLAEFKLGTLQPLECELTYINHIPKGQGWNTFGDLPNVLSDCCWLSKDGRFLSNPDKIGWQARFSLPGDNGFLRVKLSDATRKADGLPILVLELSARGLGEKKSLDHIWDWYPIAHEWIVRGFADITTLEVQNKQWERDDAARS